MGYIRPIPKYLIPWVIIGAIGLAAADKTRRAWRRLRRIPAPPQP